LIRSPLGLVLIGLIGVARSFDCDFDHNSFYGEQASSGPQDYSGIDSRWANPWRSTPRDSNGNLRVVIAYTGRQPNFLEHRVIVDAVRDMERNTGCLRFYRSRQADMNTVNITFQDRRCGGQGGGALPKRFSMYFRLCSSRQTERWRATFYHEFFHIFGLTHTQKRFDRDQYIKVHDERIEGRKKKFQYAICPESECPAYGPYECESIMHYEGVGGKDGRRIMEPLNRSQCKRFSSTMPTANDWMAVRHAIGCGWPGDLPA